MKGIHFVTDSDGRAIAVQLDLVEWGELWEDIYDSVIARERASEPYVLWEEVKERLRKAGKLDGE